MTENEMLIYVAKKQEEKLIELMGTDEAMKFFAKIAKDYMKAKGIKTLDMAQNDN